MSDFYYLIGMFSIILLGMYGGWNIIKDLANFQKNKGDYDERNFYLRMIIKDIGLIIAGVFAFILLIAKLLSLYVYI